MEPPRGYLTCVLSILIIILLTMPVITMNTERAQYDHHDGAGVRSTITDPLMKEIIFDESHRQWWSLWDTGFIGYSDLAIMMEKEGYRVSANTGSLVTNLEGQAAGDVLVLGMADRQTYSQSEIDAMLDFVNRGGGLLIMSEHEESDGSPWYTSDFLNPVSENFGITFNSNEASDADSSHPEKVIWMVTDVDVLDVQDVCLFFGNTMNLTGNAIPLATTSSTATPPNAPIIAASSYGEGRVIALTDTEFIWNGDHRIGMQYMNNSDLAKRIFEWLSNSPDAGSDTKIVPEYDLITADFFQLNLTVTGAGSITADMEGGTIEPSTINDPNGQIQFELDIQSDGYIKFKAGNDILVVNTLRSPDTNLANVLFDGRYCSRNVDESLSGMLSMAKRMRDKGILVFASSSSQDHSQYDAVFIVNPLEMPNDAQISEDTKYVLMGESYTWLYALEWPGKYSHEIRYCPMNEYAELLGLEFPHYAIYDPSEGTVNDAFRPIIHHDFGYLMKAYRSGILLNTTNMTILATGSDTAWSERLDVGERDAYVIDPVDYLSTDFSMYDDRVLGIADTDPFTNSHFGEEGTEEFTDSIISWIILSAEVNKRNGFYGQTHEFKVNTAADVNSVEVLMADGDIIKLKEGKNPGTWCGDYVVPLDSIPGDYNATIMTKENGENGFKYNINYTIDEINPWPPYKILALIVLLSCVFIIVFYAVKKRGNNSEKDQKD